MNYTLVKRYKVDFKHDDKVYGFNPPCYTFLINTQQYNLTTPCCLSILSMSYRLSILQYMLPKQLVIYYALHIVLNIFKLHSINSAILCVIINIKYIVNIGTIVKILSLPSNMIVFSPDSFDKVVLNETKDVLMEFYAPWYVQMNVIFL